MHNKLKLKQIGFTLIELMIALSIGIVLIAALMVLFINANQSVVLNDSLSRNQETGRFTLDYISQFARLAGYSEEETMPDLPLYIDYGSASSTISIDCDDAEGVACTANDVAGIRGDRLSLPYYASSQTIADCTGQESGGDDPSRYVTNVFWVDLEGILNCRVYDGEAKDWLGASAPILTGIETMEILVGVADSADSLSAARYITVDEVIASGLNNQIRALRIAILASSEQQDDHKNALQTTKEKRSYTVLDNQLDDLDDGYLRHVFTTTVAFPNSIYN